MKPGCCRCLILIEYVLFRFADKSFIFIFYSFRSFGNEFGDCIQTCLQNYLAECYGVFEHEFVNVKFVHVVKCYNAYSFLKRGLVCVLQDEFVITRIAFFGNIVIGLMLVLDAEPQNNAP